MALCMIPVLVPLVPVDIVDFSKLFIWTEKMICQSETGISFFFFVLVLAFVVIVQYVLIVLTLHCVTDAAPIN